jgi:hypothetical protein
MEKQHCPCAPVAGRRKRPTMLGLSLLLITAVLLLVLAVLLILPLPWSGDKDLPRTKLGHELESHYAKGRHIYLAEPLDVEQCLDNLLLVKKVFDQVGIRRWFLSEGSALGMYRDRHLLPFDDDLDLCMDGDSLPLFLSHAFPLLMEQGFVHVHNNARSPMICLMRGGEKVDISFLVPGKIFSNDFLCDKIIPLVQELRPIEVRGETVNIPAQEAYYRHLYGSDWRIPQRNRKVPV